MKMYYLTITAEHRTSREQYTEIIDIIAESFNDAVNKYISIMLPENYIIKRALIRF